MDGAAVPLQRSAQRLLGFLALQDRPLERGFVAGTLWTNLPEHRASASLRTALWRATTGHDALVAATTTHVGLGADVEVDVRDVSALAHAVLEHRPCLADRLLRARGDLLPDWYDDWAVVERERHRQLRLHALEALCRDLAARGEYPQAVEAGIAAVAIEPLRESAHRALIAAHLEEGNAVEAIREYRTFTRLLRRELGISPSPRIRELADRALDGRGSSADGAVSLVRVGSDHDRVY